ncbi:MAG: sugar phosphate isomerase/epimerase, partial [Actinobacteria bacterium]|nr:sugar phosphate isomerase/epimerase [Actinomycetota bacterium]
AAEQGVRVAIELHHGTLADSADGAHRLLDAVAHPAVGLVLDPANLMQTPAPFGAAAVDALGDRLLHVHVKDHAIVPGGDPGAYPFRDYLRHIGQWVPRMEVPRLRQGPPWYAKRSLGDGHVPWPAILARLRERGYGGYLILESEAGPGMPTGHELARQDAATLTRWIGSA